MRLLVVEDDRALAAGLRAGLEAEGFAVDVAGDGVDGLGMARENTYDAVLLDLMLPAARRPAGVPAAPGGVHLDAGAGTHRT